MGSHIFCAIWKPALVCKLACPVRQQEKFVYRSEQRYHLRDLETSEKCPEISRLVVIKDSSGSAFGSRRALGISRLVPNTTSFGEVGDDRLDDWMADEG